MTAACGLTHSFVQLFLARLGVGVGEAGGVAPAYSLLCDYFPARQRARALSVYSFGIPIGSAAGIVIGGFITSWMNWRTAFFVVGLAGLALAPLLKWTVREPVRGKYDDPADRSQAAGESRPSLLDVLRLLARKPSFWGLSLGSASASMMGYGLFFWMPSFLVRSFSLTLVQASLAYGGLILIGGLIGIWLGRRDRGSLRTAAQSRLRAHSGHRLRGHAALLCHRRHVHDHRPRHGRSDRADGTRAHVVGARAHRHPASGARHDARHRVGDISVHQQFDRDRRGHHSDRRSLGCFQSQGRRLSIHCATRFCREPAFMCSRRCACSLRRVKIGRDWVG